MNENTRLVGIKQEILDLKNEVSTLISNFKDEIQQKFETINNILNTMENSIKTIISDQVSESVMKVKDSVTEALKEDNIKVQNKVEILEEQLSENKLCLNKLDKYNRGNNIEIQGIPSSISDNALENKVNDIEGCHMLGKANPQNTIVRFVNRKFCYEALEKKTDPKNVNNSDLGFESSAKLFICENLTPLNQQLTWMCRVLKCSGKIQLLELKGCCEIKKNNE